MRVILFGYFDYKFFNTLTGILKIIIMLRKLSVWNCVPYTRVALPPATPLVIVTPQWGASLPVHTCVVFGTNLCFNGTAIGWQVVNNSKVEITVCLMILEKCAKFDHYKWAWAFKLLMRFCSLGSDVTLWTSMWVMNSITPSSAQYVRGGSLPEDLFNGRGLSPSLPSPPEPRGHFSNGLLNDVSKDASDEPDEVDRLKLKFMSAWNNVKYGLYPFTHPSTHTHPSNPPSHLSITFYLFCSIGFSVKTKTFFNKTSPLILLGQSYFLNTEGKLWSLMNSILKGICCFCLSVM